MAKFVPTSSPTLTLVERTGEVRALDDAERVAVVCSLLDVLPCLTYEAAERHLAAREWDFEAVVAAHFTGALTTFRPTMTSRAVSDTEPDLPAMVDQCVAAAKTCLGSVCRPSTYTRTTSDLEALGFDVAVAAAAAATAARAAEEEEAIDVNDEGVWTSHGGTELEPSLTIDPQLGDSPVKLLDARFLIELSARGGTLRCRQELPEEAFMPLHTLRRMAAGGLGGACLRVIAVSWMWLRLDHPDPTGCSLGVLASALETFINDAGASSASTAPTIPEATRDSASPSRNAGGTSRATNRRAGGHAPRGGASHRTAPRSYAVFLDYCCQHQPAAAYPHTPECDELQSRALHETLSWYGHPHVITLKLTQQPPGYPKGFTAPAAGRQRHVDGTPASPRPARRRRPALTACRLHSPRRTGAGHPAYPRLHPAHPCCHTSCECTRRSALPTRPAHAHVHRRPPP